MNILFIMLLLLNAIPICTLIYLETIPIQFPLSLFCLISLLSLLLSVICYIFQNTKFQTFLKSYEEIKLSNINLQTLCDKLRIYKHDNVNVIQAITGLVEAGDSLRLKKYIKDLHFDVSEITHLAALNPDIINNYAIYELLSFKFYKATDSDVTMNFEIYLDLNNLAIKDFHLSKILGILLDNAIEASKNCKEKIINVKMLNDYTAKRKLIIIENTYNNKDLNIDKLFEKGFSTKPNNTGLGLWEVKKILNKYDNLNLFTSNNDEYFSQQLEIYDK